jgi:peptidoglycan/xylan/chitin deacetylase (PgdA/CDA1 family)
MAYILLVLSVLLQVNAFDISAWPKFGSIPPINKTWTNAILNSQYGQLNVFQACKNSKDWALTFDDGPSKFII